MNHITNNDMICVIYHERECGEMTDKETRIREIRIYQAVSRLSRPIADATHDISKIAFYVLEVETTDRDIFSAFITAPTQLRVR